MTTKLTQRPVLIARPRRRSTNTQYGLHTVVVSEGQFRLVQRVKHQTGIPVRTILDEAIRFYLAHVKIEKEV